MIDYLLTVLVTFLCLATLGGPSRAAQDPASAFHANNCDASFWEHVYHGKFATAQDRLTVIDPCVTVTGTLEAALAEADGDRHIRLKVDPQFKKLLNARNIAGEKGFLVVEPVCELKVAQKDTLQEGVCQNFHPNLYRISMHGKHISVTGAYIQDQSPNHGWREIHPVTSITVIN
ncbi:MAG TPA: hypothetical protein VKQ28_17600 [Candidatus Acidoferrum sp.]|nr:hypothetical protein [Candidatus Acidoferrum sp.]